MSQKRTLTLTLDEEQVDATLTALQTEVEAAEDNIPDLPGSEVVGEERFLDAVRNTRVQIATGWSAQPKQLEQARELYHTDWDADGSTSIYLPRERALALVQALGWTVETRTASNSDVGGSFQRGPREYPLYIAPDGSFSTFELDEALSLALVAQSYTAPAS